jgi:hypothetical protein
MLSTHGNTEIQNHHSSALISDGEQTVRKNHPAMAEPVSAQTWTDKGLCRINIHYGSVRTVL